MLVSLLKKTAFKFLGFILVYTSCLPGSLYAQIDGPDNTNTVDQCTRWLDFSTLGLTEMSINGALTYSEIQINAALIYRPLLVEEDTYWLGIQLYQPTIEVDDQDVESNLYSVPFAVKLDKTENRVQQTIFNAPLKDADRSKLFSIYQALHISKADGGELLKEYLVEGADDLGTFEVKYQISKNSTTKSKQRYTRIGQDASNNIMASINQIDINKDQTFFQQDNCWHTLVEGNSNTQVLSENNFLDIQVAQQTDLALKPEPLPADARLLMLPLDPTKWEMLPEEDIYPKPLRQPESSGDDFLRKLSILDLANMSSEAILQFLYNNDEYLPLLKGPLWASSYEDEFEKRLFLMIGKTDSPNAHWLLTEVYADESFNGDARFRSLMALKYAEKPLSTELVDQILFYSLQPLEGENAELANSALFTLGIVAKNQLDEDFGQYLSGRLATELKDNNNRQQSAALLTALGNSGDNQQQSLVERYLANDDSLLRERSALALAQMPGEKTLKTLSSQLFNESNSRVQSAIINGMGANQLNGQQLNQVYSYARESDENRVRHSAIKALANQVESTPEVKSQLKELIKTEKNRNNLQEIMRAIYSK